MLLISFPRGDMITRSFVIRAPDSSVFTDTLDEIYFTVKRKASDRNFCFQKRLTESTIISLGNGRYQFTIMPEDTDGLPFGEYVFDIELVITDTMKSTFTGNFVLTDEVTHAVNEV